MYNNEEGDTNGYKTPASFRRTESSRRAAERDNLNNRTTQQQVADEPVRNEETQTEYADGSADMSNPYMDKGYSMPYQISQNKYKEQIFGSSSVDFSNYGSREPDNIPTIDGRSLPWARKELYRENEPQQTADKDRHEWQIGLHPLEVDRDMRPDPYASPRYPYAHNAYEQNPQPTYRGGRPDMGFAQGDRYVPYPQEPLNRRNMEYMPPPEIGQQRYEPSNDQQVVKHERSLEDGGEPHPGWVLLLRYHRDGDAMVRRALHMAHKHIDMDGGWIMGIAPPYGVRIREGGDGWVSFGRMRNFGAGDWQVQQSPSFDETSYCVLAIYYPSLSRAIQWFDRDSAFKQKDFPPPNCTDCIVLPLNSSVDTQYRKTLVLTEYPKISHPEYFRDKYSIPTEDMMRSRFKSSPYVVKASSIPTDDPRHRVAKHLRGSWIKRNSVITLSMFDSITETNRYFTDPEFCKCKEAQDRVSAPTTVILDLERWGM